ncbi:hypothetical protein APHAL10511_007836 [Amanita phalloides]|nr:hypothetical protein APHAL10511_007836 [Amanita phalloides]
MVASKTSILVAAVALGAASVYAAPAILTKDITLSRRQGDDSALIARDFDDDELYAREFFDELDARDFEDDALEARDFDEDELFARELYEDDLEARAFNEDGEFEGSSTSTPSSTPTSSASVPSSTSTDATKDKHVLAVTSPSTLNSGKGVHRKHHKHHDSHHHRMCGPYMKAYQLMTGEALGEHKVGEHDLHAHDLHTQDHHEQDHHPKHPTKQPKHRHQRHHRPTAKEISEECGREIAALHQHHTHGAVVDASAHPTELKVQTHETSKIQTPETLKIQTPTKAKRGLNQLWARVVGRPADLDTKSSVQGYPDAAGQVGAESSPLPGGAENLAATPGSDGQQGPLSGEHRKSHHRHQHKHHHHHCHQNPHSRHCRHHHRRPHHHRKHPKQDATGAAGLDSAKIAEPNAPVSDATAVGNGAPSAAEPGAHAVRRSLEDEIWERSLASSLGLDEDYFTKRFYDEDVSEF